MTIVYKVHPAIGVARVGDSDESYFGPETGGGLPILRDGRPFGSSDFRDATGKIRRQAARFCIYRYDTNRPDDPGEEVVAGQDGVKAIEWRVHLANKKAVWYEFQTVVGQDGYAPDHPLRNSLVTNPNERRALIIDPGPRTLTGPGQRARFARGSNPDGYPMTWPPELLEPAAIDCLGEIETDDAGRLAVVGGYGLSGTNRAPLLGDYVNNDDWWDDTSDGPVSACVMLDGDAGLQKVEVQYPAWVIVGPPGFAPQIVNLVTLYDTMYDVAVRSLGHRPDIYRDSLWQDDYAPHFETEIAPILRRGATYPWVVPIPPHAHKFDLQKLGDPDPAYAGLRQFIFGILRPPGGPDLLVAPAVPDPYQVNAGVPGLTMMPYLAGDNAYFFGAPTSKFLKLTETQYFFLRQWARGVFQPGHAPPEPPGPALDRAALENCVGGSFSPGIEMTWICRNPALYQEPFRLKHKKGVTPPLSLGEDFALGLEPGDACKQMALPWQADFNDCSTWPVNLQAGPASTSVTNRILWWWPAQRPVVVWRRDPEAPEGRRQVPWIGTFDDQLADDYVQFADYLEMVQRWSELGFIYNFGSSEQPEFLLVEAARKDGKR